MISTGSARADLGLDLLERAVGGGLCPDDTAAPSARELALANKTLARAREKFGSAVDKLGFGPPGLVRRWHANRPRALTLADAAQLSNVRECVDTVLADEIPGDLIEAGVFRGGQTILMRGILAARGVTDRRVFVADSFAGLPDADPRIALDDAIAQELLEPIGGFRVSADEVRANFAAFGLLDEQVVFLEGWFKDTLPNAPIEQLAVMRLDGDFYQSTRDALETLYPRLAPGGFAIIDDYGAPLGCRRAVRRYRARHGITAELVPVNHQTVYWRKP